MRELELAKRLAVKAGDLLLKEASGRRRVGYKDGSTANVVTEMDRVSEEIIVRGLLREFPDHAVVAEERGARGDSPFCWHIDPLDGTTNYAHGLPIWSVSVALAVRGRVEAGVIYAPTFGELYWARRGHGAFRNGRRIRVSRTRRLEEALLATGFNYREPFRSRNLRYFGEFMARAQAVRRPGSASLDLAWIAGGRLDGHWEFGLGSWDMAAGIVIAEEAGARVTDLGGRRIDLSAGEIVAANPRIHGQMLAVIRGVRI